MNTGLALIRFCVAGLQVMVSLATAIGQMPGRGRRALKRHPFISLLTGLGSGPALAVAHYFFHLPLPLLK
jgi:hypothetical protein